jgi:hypothetical protein
MRLTGVFLETVHADGSVKRGFRILRLPGRISLQPGDTWIFLSNGTDAIPVHRVSPGEETQAKELARTLRGHLSESPELREAAFQILYAHDSGWKQGLHHALEISTLPAGAEDAVIVHRDGPDHAVISTKKFPGGVQAHFSGDGHKLSLTPLTGNLPASSELIIPGWHLACAWDGVPRDYILLRPGPNHPYTGIISTGMSPFLAEIRARNSPGPQPVAATDQGSKREPDGAQTPVDVAADAAGRLEQ